MINLEARLKRIAGFVPNCTSFADIGADHGLLSAYLLERRICQRAQLVDISSSSLDKARALIDRMGLADRARIIVGDGARVLFEKPDCAVIAGMGGPTIASIVERAGDILRDSLLITQPNVGMYELRRRLSLSGYAIEDEEVVSSQGRWYVIITARAGESSYDEIELMAGPRLIRRGGEDFKDYVNFRIGIAEKALKVERKGLDAPTVAMRGELAIWREVEKCL